MAETSTTTTSNTVNQRTAANLRAVADLLDQHPDLVQPYVVSSSSGGVVANWYLSHYDDGRDKAAAVVAAIDGGWVRGEANHQGPLATWTQRRGEVELYIQVARDQVCDRVVVGTETVTVPAEDAVEALPERTETREIVEWRCQPLLAGLDETAVA